MSERFLSYGRQSITEDDITAVIETLKSDFLTQGPAIPKFEADFCRVTGARHAIACSNGTAALHIAALAAGIKRGDRALVTPMTFVASANCIRYAGGDVAFADIDGETLTMSPIAAEIALEKAVDEGRPFRAIVTVDLAGHPCDMEAFSRLKKKYGLIWIHDACHSLGGSWTDAAGRVWKVGEYPEPDTVAWSFHPVKHITTGEGGMVTTFSDQIADRLRLLRTHGIQKDPASLVFRNEAFDADGQVNPWYYEMQSLGFNYRLTDIQAALGSSQLKRLHAGIQRRTKIVEVYRSGLSGLNGIRQPPVRAGVGHAYHLAVIRIDFTGLGTSRARVMRNLRERNIGTQVHYVPVPMMPYYAGIVPMGNLPQTIAYYRETLSLPCYPDLQDDDIERVVTAVREVLA
ncbi:MAG TPA: UDP-4-amino-4,6-dideoxy-N-acetyl-beta-L-altrosamine transaminase [Candidatus Ozemobacteraceae bacterium]|nr:UDP-4-amino-4,6-dideoxy-N-acetyl-beta-L-altrosamine transaminase [Candidatus Ozemobacteraceae bacterium]